MIFVFFFFTVCFSYRCLRCINIDISGRIIRITKNYNDYENEDMKRLNLFYVSGYFKFLISLGIISLQLIIYIVG